MGNEASLEGGEGLGAFPEGAAAAGDGGGPAAPLQHLVPAGVEADLSQLSEEERRQIAAVMSRAQGLPRGNLAGAEPPPMQRHARNISLFPLLPSSRVRVLAVGRGASLSKDPGPLQREQALHFASRGRKGGGSTSGGRQDGAFTLWLASLWWFLITGVLGASELRPLPSPPFALIRSTGNFCVWGEGRDLNTTFGVFLCVCVCVCFTRLECPTAQIVSTGALPRFCKLLFLEKDSCCIFQSLWL